MREILKCTHKKVNQMLGLKNSPLHALKTNYFKWLVCLAAGFSLAFLVILTWQSYLSYSDFQKLITTGESINESNALIGQFDEALTMSARMAAATGDRQWEARYRLLEPQLDEEIQKVKKLAPELAATKGAKKTDEANQVLVEMEYRSFRLIGEGRQEAARTLLSSREYEEAKHIYASGLQQIRAGLSERTQSFLQVAHARLVLTLTLVGAILPLLLVLWAWIIRTARNNSAKRLAAEKALNESQKQYFNLVEGTPDLITQVSADGRFLFVNHAALEIYGLAPEECIGRLAFDFIHPEDRVTTEIAFQAWRKGGMKAFTHENRMIGIDGRIHHLAWCIRSEHDGNGNISGFASTGRDITERKKIEDLLLQSEVELKGILDATADGILAVDSHGKLIKTSRQFANLWRIPQSLMDTGDDQKLLNFVLEQLSEPEAFLKKVQELYCSIHKDVDTVSFKDGRVFERYSSPLIKEGSQIGRVWSFRDVTDRKRLEAEKAKLEEQNRQLQKAESLGRMSGSIAHIFNNQLQIVMGYLGMVIGELTPGDSRAVKLSKAMQATIKASEVSGHLLSYLGQRQVKSELLDLSELCRLSLPLLQAGKPESVTLETDLPSPGPCINADAKQIQQILSNLVINAWEAIGARVGTIRLTVNAVSQADITASRRFPVDWQSREQQYACVEVTDSGCGIMGKDMDKLFDPFYSTKFTGRGLGLSVVLGIVKTHAAVITVENGIGCGSVFKVFFPLSAQMAPRQIEQISKVPKIVPGGTVLLVEDDEGVRNMTEIALATLGFNVLPAGDGVEAVEIFETHKDEISCLLCDLTMPRMNGWETIYALRAIRHDLPVVLASGYDEASVMAGSHPELPDFFLSKPYDLNKLSDTIGHAMARRGALGSAEV